MGLVAAAASAAIMMEEKRARSWSAVAQQRLVDRFQTQAVAQVQEIDCGIFGIIPLCGLVAVDRCVRCYYSFVGLSSGGGGGTVVLARGGDRQDAVKHPIYAGVCRRRRRIAAPQTMAAAGGGRWWRGHGIVVAPVGSTAATVLKVVRGFGRYHVVRFRGNAQALLEAAVYHHPECRLVTFSVVARDVVFGAGGSVAFNDCTAAKEGEAAEKIDALQRSWK